MCFDLSKLECVKSAKFIVNGHNIYDLFLPRGNPKFLIMHIKHPKRYRLTDSSLSLLH